MFEIIEMKWKAMGEIATKLQFVSHMTYVSSQAYSIQSSIFY